MSSLPLGNSQDITGFSPADFQDAEDVRPMQVQLDITSTGTLVPYSQLVSNVYNRHMHEIRDSAHTTSPAVPTTWRKRLREFYATKHEDLLQVLKRPLGPNSPLKRSEQFLSKFGRADFQASHPSLQHITLDASGSALSQIETELKRIGPASCAEIVEEVKWLYDEYKRAGEEALCKESIVKLKLDTLDKTYQKVIGFSELPVNEDTEELGTAIETYLKKTVDMSGLEKDYTEMIEAYRRFATLKEALTLFRFIELQDKEPLCSICMTDSVQFALSPCGHTFCGTCVKRQSASCYMCRTTIRDRVKIYFG
jgi:hypothetical protein